MKIHASGILILTFVNFVRLEFIENGFFEGLSSGEEIQFSDLIKSNENFEAKRSPELTVPSELMFADGNTESKRSVEPQPSEFITQVENVDIKRSDNEPITIAVEENIDAKRSAEPQPSELIAADQNMDDKRSVEPRPLEFISPVEKTDDKRSTEPLSLDIIAPVENIDAKRSVEPLALDIIAHAEKTDDKRSAEPMSLNIIAPLENTDSKRSAESLLLDSVAQMGNNDNKRSPNEMQPLELIAPNEHIDVKRSHFSSYERYPNPEPYRPKLNVPNIMNILKRPSQSEGPDTGSYSSQITMPNMMSRLQRPTAPTEQFESGTYRSKMNFPNIIGMQITRPAQLENPEQESYSHSMTNIFNNPSRPAEMPSNTLEAPKYLFSSVHMKLIPKSEESREDALLRGFQPGVRGGLFGPPEIIVDAKNPHSSESEQQRNNIGQSGLFQIRSSTRIPYTDLSKLDEPIVIEGSPEKSSLEEVTPPPTRRPLLLLNKPSFRTQGTNRFGAIDSASNIKKPLVKINVKSNLKIIKTKVGDPSTPSEKALHSSEERDEVEAVTKTTPKPKEKKKPTCPSGRDFVEGSKDLWKEFHNAKSWSSSFGAVADTAKKATTSVGSCFKSMWRGVSHIFGFGNDDDEDNSKSKRTPQPEDLRKARAALTTTTKKPNTTPKPKDDGMWEKTKKTAVEAKEGFKKHVAKPLSSFFIDVADKAKAAFSRRSTDLNDNATPNVQVAIEIEDSPRS